MSMISCTLFAHSGRVGGSNPLGPAISRWFFVAFVDGCLRLIHCAIGHARGKSAVTISQAPTVVLTALGAWP
jgi:hypothetical protein